jgi:hypothetical protein
MYGGFQIGGVLVSALLVVSQTIEVLSYGFGLFMYVNVRSRVAMVGLLRISCSIVHDVSDVNWLGFYVHKLMRPSRTYIGFNLVRC